jgi:hypothetical protein
MKHCLLKIIFRLQKLLLWLSYRVCRLLPAFARKPVTWVVGVDETAGLLGNIAAALPGAYSVKLGGSAYHDFAYDFALPHRRRHAWLTGLQRLVCGPLLLGWLLNRAEGFIFIWSTGFLKEGVDQREFEFSFIRDCGKKLVCYFVGNDVRSPALTRALGARLGFDVISVYDDQAAPIRAAAGYEAEKKRIAEVAERYAGLIFNPPVDQTSYLQGPTAPFIYFLDESKFQRNPEKFADPAPPRIVHAPSSPFIKGTPLVRAAIARLRHEGYRFEYIELIGVPNQRVWEELRLARIVLNEFYAFMPGVFGVEAMASYCALVTSADATIETSLPPDSNQAWLVTRPWAVYDNLKLLLDQPQLQLEYAEAGYRWAERHAAFAASSQELLRQLEKA